MRERVRKMGFEGKSVDKGLCSPIGWLGTTYLIFLPFLLFLPYFFTTILTTNVPLKGAPRFLFLFFSTNIVISKFLRFFFEIISIISQIQTRKKKNPLLFCPQKTTNKQQVFFVFFFFPIFWYWKFSNFFPELEKLLGFTLQKDKNFPRFSQILCLQKKKKKKKVQCQPLW